jgi:5-methylcytosine-specific restriction endonuclease McrA
VLKRWRQTRLGSTWSRILWRARRKRREREAQREYAHRRREWDARAARRRRNVYLSGAEPVAPTRTLAHWRRTAERSDAEIEADLEAIAAQDLWLSEHRWHAYLRVGEGSRVRRPPLGGTTAGWIGKMLEAQRNRCFYCTSPIDRTSIHCDHVYPLKLMGLHHVSNIVLACPACNLAKGALHPVEWVARSPRVPRRHRESLLADIRSRAPRLDGPRQGHA